MFPLSRLLTKPYLVAILILCVQGWAVAADRVDDEETAVLLGDSIIPSTTYGRSVQPIDKVAENVTVITRADIVRLQVRTLDQLLLYYPGVLPYPSQFPSGFATPMIQGLHSRQCLVTLDGVPINALAEGAVDLSLIPVGNFDSIEIVKGPTSSLWGRSVGASINITTRDPAEHSKATGYLNATLGRNNTNSAESVVSGTFESTKTGYLLAGSGGYTDGFERNIRGDSHAFYGKIKQQFGDKTSVSAVVGTTGKSEKPLSNPQANVRSDLDVDVVYGIFNIRNILNSRSSIDFNVFHFDVTIDQHYFNIYSVPPFIPVAGINLKNQKNIERFTGLQLAYKYNGASFWLSAGADGTLSRLRINVNEPFSVPVDTVFAKNLNIGAGYIAGGLDLTDRLTLTSSFRYDWYSDLNDTYAPSAGLIYKLADKTIFRATYGMGNSMPTLTNKSKEFETLWRVQGGVETNNIPGIWLKTNLFFDRTKNVRENLLFLDQRPETNSNLIRQGAEIEIKTLPVYNTSFGLGYTYTDIYNSDTKVPIHGLPRHQLIGNLTWKKGMTDVAVYSRYVNYNNAPLSNDAVQWDILASHTVATWGDRSLSLRLAARNVTSSKQSPSSIAYGYVPLLITGGVRVEF